MHCFTESWYERNWIIWLIKVCDVNDLWQISWARWVCALGRSVGSCPRNGLDLLIYSACVSWPSSHTHPMTKCVFHFKCSLVALRLKNGSLPTHTDAGRFIDKLIHTHTTEHWLSSMTREKKIKREVLKGTILQKMENSAITWWLYM